MLSGGCDIMQDEIINKLKDVFTFDEEPREFEGRIYMKISSDKLRDLALFVRNELGFTYGNMAYGTDTKEVMEMSWYVGHPESHLILVLRSSGDREKPVFPTLSDLWEGFGWHEREAYDLLGIDFTDHKDLRRIYLPDNWEGHPLREDYVYKRPKYYKPEDDLNV